MTIVIEGGANLELKVKKTKLENVGWIPNDFQMTYDGYFQPLAQSSSSYAFIIGAELHPTLEYRHFKCYWTYSCG